MSCTMSHSPRFADGGEDTAVASGEASVGPSPDSTRLVELVRRSGSGQQDAFAELYDKTSARIYGVVLRVLRSPDQAAEVTQEVYLEVWRQAARFSPDKGGVLGWMTTVAHRRAIDRVRSITSAAVRDHRYALEAVQPAHDDAWSGVEQRLDADLLRCALRTMSAIQREAILLVYFGGYSQTQVATMLDIPLGTLKTRIRDGLIRLRRALQTPGAHGRSSAVSPASPAVRIGHRDGRTAGGEKALTASMTCAGERVRKRSLPPQPPHVARRDSAA
jgi:RNA polymerase sigma-70 factor, ECF subfamily